MKCGACKQSHSSVGEVRACYGNRKAFGGEARPGGNPKNFNRDYSPETRKFLRQARDRLAALRKGQRISEEEIDAEYIELVRRRHEDREDEQRRTSSTPSLKVGSEGPLRECQQCGREVVNCSHLEAFWCNPCRELTTRPGLHQNCIPGEWK